ncbi:hypothetical protein WME88_53395 [Sorangium sp. So ce216]
MGSQTCRLMITPRDGLTLLPEIEPARLQSVPGPIRAAVGEGAVSADVTRTESDLPVILAGPILRRTDADGIKIWIATSARVTVRATLYSESPRHEWAAVATSGPASVLRLGSNLYVQLVSLAAPIEEGRLYGYDLAFGAPEGMEFTHGDGLIPRAALVYRHYLYPTFLRGLSRSARKLNVLHASCRKLHGPGTDAVTSMDAHMEQQAATLDHRPAALLLTGDQIYADDVSPSILGAVMRASEALLGFPEYLPGRAGQHRTTAEVQPNLRWEVVRNGGLTVDRECGVCHLMGLGEYGCMYLLAWSPALWQWPRIQSVYGATFDEQRPGVTALRRVMANVPTYMIMDDHEISDDWPMTAGMWTEVERGELGAWIVANGKAACWAFQLWGNGTPPGTPVEGPIRAFVDACLASRSDRARLEAARDQFVARLFPAAGFTCVVPTHPKVVMLDTRTERELVDGPPGLLRAAALDRLNGLVQALQTEAPAPLLLVSPAPVIGFGLLEGIQALFPAPARDPEAWSLNHGSFQQFLRVLAAADRSAVVVFSGDVHYSFCATATLPAHGRRIHGTPIIQLTSSSLRNQIVGFQGFFLANTTIAHVQLLSGVHFHPLTASSLLFPKNNFGAVTIGWDESGAATVAQTLIGPEGTAPVTLSTGG